MLGGSETGKEDISIPAAAEGFMALESMSSRLVRSAASPSLLSFLLFFFLGMIPWGHVTVCGRGKKSLPKIADSRAAFEGGVLFASAPDNIFIGTGGAAARGLRLSTMLLRL
jgi:hypothetical protein